MSDHNLADVTLPSDLEELKTRTLKALSPLLKTVIQKIDEDAFQLELNKGEEESLSLDGADGDPKAEALDALMQHLPRYRSQVEDTFFTEVKKAFADVLKKPKNEATKIRKGRLAKRKSAASNLSLMDDSELELQIAVGRLSKTINESQPIELAHLCLRVEKIINRRIEGKQNPLGPVVLGQALSQGLLLMEEIKPSLRVFVDYFEAELEPVLTALYKECNEYLIGRRVLPDLDEDDVNERFFEEDEEVKKEAETRRKNLLEQVSGKDSEVVGDKLLRSLDQMVHRHEQDDGVKEHVVETAADARELSQDEILQVINSLQTNDGLGSFTDRGAGYATFDSGNLSQHVQNTLRADNVGFDAAAEGALSSLSMMFSEILSRDSVTTPIKDLISHMQVPVLKAAVMDEAFFADAENPAQNLIDDLVSATSSWSPQKDDKRDPLYQKVASVVDYVGQNFDDDYEVFETASHELKNFVEGEERRARILEKRMLERETAKARVEEARDITSEVLHEKTKDLNLPDVARELLFDNWEKVLFLIYNKQGPESIEWSEALVIVDNVVRALKRDAALDHEQFYKDLSTGLLDSGIDAFKVDGLMDQFKEMLADVPDKNVDAELTLDESEELSALSVETNAETSVSDEALLSSAYAEISSDMSEPSESVVTFDVEAEEEIYIPDEFDALVEKLTAGTWLQFLEFGMVSKLRLAAFIKHTGVFVFVDRSGAKKAEHSSQELAALFREKAVNMLEDNVLFDQALESVIGRLRGH